MNQYLITGAGTTLSLKEELSTWHLSGPFIWRVCPCDLTAQFNQLIPSSTVWMESESFSPYSFLSWHFFKGLGVAESTVYIKQKELCLGSSDITGVCVSGGMSLQCFYLQICLNWGHPMDQSKQGLGTPCPEANSLWKLGKWPHLSRHLLQYPATKAVPNCQWVDEKGLLQNKCYFSDLLRQKKYTQADFCRWTAIFKAIMFRQANEDVSFKERGIRTTNWPKPNPRWLATQYTKLRSINCDGEVHIRELKWEGKLERKSKITSSSLEEKDRALPITCFHLEKIRQKGNLTERYKIIYGIDKNVWGFFSRSRNHPMKQTGQRIWRNEREHTAQD